ncbi:MAG: glutaredoxin 3 [Legionella sp.]|nr:glutaredoxin 3 [Legionella sp.]
MAEIIIYSSEHCSYCVRAKELLKRKNVPFNEIRVDVKDEFREEMIEKSGRRTVPQIFINGQAIGGFDDLYALDKQGQLDELLREG